MDWIGLIGFEFLKVILYGGSLSFYYGAILMDRKTLVSSSDLIIGGSVQPVRCGTYKQEIEPSEMLGPDQNKKFL